MIIWYEENHFLRTFENTFSEPWRYILVWLIMDIHQEILILLHNFMYCLYDVNYLHYVWLKNNLNLKVHLIKESQKSTSSIFYHTHEKLDIVLVKNITSIPTRNFAKMSLYVPISSKMTAATQNPNSVKKIYWVSQLLTIKL